MPNNVDGITPNNPESDTAWLFHALTSVPENSGPGTRGLLARPLSSGVQKERDYAK
jgi:hypothetical protein